MIEASIHKKFKEMGAVVAVDHNDGLHRPVVVDVRNEVFEIVAREDVNVRVVDIDPKLRHLLLHVQDGKDKMKFLCGHDERHWFVAAVPGNGVSSVEKAMESLKPIAVREMERSHPVKNKKRNKRKNEIFVRQGEWFFTPEPGFRPAKDAIIMKNEPIRRGRGKPHNCEYLHRSGGESVWVHGSLAPNGVLEKEYMKLSANSPHGWRPMRRNARVLVKGRISHADHATIMLNGWHAVSMNTEGGALGATNVAFLD
jgi:hypothetical protein